MRLTHNMCLAHIQAMTSRPETKLAQWMRDKKVRDQWLADQIGVSQSQACRIRLGAGTSPERAFRIEGLTKGRVKASDLLLFSAEVPSPRKAA